MRILIAGFLLTVLSVAVGCSTDTAATPAAGETTRMSFTVENMMCEEACAASVRDILAGQPGVIEATVDFEAKTATCLIDDSTFDPAAAIAELDDKGFAASVQE